MISVRLDTEQRGGAEVILVTHIQGVTYASLKWVIRIRWNPAALGYIARSVRYLKSMLVWDAVGKIARQ
jgi:hypothetical protein